nr:hypothetical protein [Planctomycetota bacterium]
EAAWSAVAPDGKIAFGQAWKRPFTAAAFGVVDLVALLGNGTNVCAYAGCTITAAADVQGWLLLGSDDGVTAWLDDKEVWRNPAMRGVTPDQDHVAVRLAAGEHQLVLRIDQGGGGWGFCARLAADEAGTTPLAGVHLSCPTRAATPAAAPAVPDAPPAAP